MNGGVSDYFLTKIWQSWSQTDGIIDVSFAFVVSEELGISLQEAQRLTKNFERRKNEEV